jgi:dCMP deaminase
MSNDGIQNVITRICKEILSDEARTQIDKWRESRQKVSRSNWHIHFILQAYLASTRSLDAQTKHGCILVKNNRIIGTGYNSFIREINDKILPNLRPDKYPFMIHSEQNAILNCAKNGISTNNSNAYITGPPCCDCLQYMYQAGVQNIYYANNNKAEMTKNKEYDINFEILSNLMQKINIYSINLDETTMEKIRKIQSC